MDRYTFNQTAARDKRSAVRKALMRNEPVVTWVVYEKQMPGKSKMTLMCEQPDWDRLELIQPNFCTIVQSGITNEAVAEQLARSGALVVKSKEHSNPVSPAHTPASGRAVQQAALRTFWEQSERAAAAESPAQRHARREEFRRQRGRTVVGPLTRV